MDLQDQRLRALAPQLHPWVRYQFLAFETHDDKGRALDRSVGWGVGWYNGEKFHWFAYTSPDGWLQVNMSLRMSKKDMDEMSAGGRLDARGALEHDIPGTATHVAFSDGGMTWVHEFCIKDSSVCNTAGALEKYLLANADKAMPDRILFYTRGYFPY
ncbi:MAG: hypothetical protein Q7R69_01000 [bacterium]|nr:hypothetical protein [bacterium]